MANSSTYSQVIADYLARPAWNSDGTTLAIADHFDHNIITNSTRGIWQTVYWNIHWYHAAYICLAHQIWTCVWRYWWKAPSNIRIIAYPTLVGRWLMAWHMMIDSATIVQKAYDSSDGKPFAVPTISRWIIFVSDQTRLKQLENEHESVLSAEQALHELACTDTVLGNHKIPAALDGFRSENLRVVVSILKNKLRNSMPQLSGPFRQRIKEAVIMEASGSNDPTEIADSEWRTVRLAPALLHIFARINLISFFGEEDGRNPEIFDDIMAFYSSCALAYPLLNLAPNLFASVIVPLALQFGAARRKVFALLLRLTRQAREESTPGCGNIVSWAADISKLNDPADVARITLGLLFAGAFQIPMIAQSCVYRICKHREYFDTLLKEAENYGHHFHGTVTQEMPYMDSFMKETARLSPGPIVTSPRTVVKPYTSPEDGYHVTAGSWVAVPQTAIMQDEAIWSDAKSFRAFRFVNDNQESSAQFSHPSYEYPVWGSVRRACPSRFYVSYIMKAVLAHLITEYEIELDDPSARPFITFGIVRLPSPFMKIKMRKRKVTALRQHTKQDSVQASNM